VSRLPDPYLREAREPGPRDDPRCGAAFPEPRPDRAWAALGRVEGVVTWRKVFPGTARRVAEARALARLFLDDTARAGDAAWIAGELAANAVRHTRSGADGGSYILELGRAGDLARIVVYDLGGGGRPTFTRSLPTFNLDEHGYGLYGVAELAQRTGVRGNPLVGHAVWAELRLGGASPACPGEAAASAEPGRPIDPGVRTDRPGA